MSEASDQVAQKNLRSGAFSSTEAAGGLLLMAAAAAALIVANSALGEAYRHLLHLEDRADADAEARADDGRALDQ